MLYVFVVYVIFFFFKQKTAYEMRISDWSSDVCSSDLFLPRAAVRRGGDGHAADLLDQLLEDRLGEGLVVVGGHHEGALAADHVLAVVVGHRAVLVEDGQAVDGDALQHRHVAQAVGRGALVGTAVAGDVDHPPAPLEAVAPELGHAELDGAADRGAAAVEKARRGVDRRRKVGDVVLVRQQLPVDRHLLAAVVGPLDHRHGDAAAAGGDDGGDHRGLAEGTGEAAHLQVELLGRHRGGGVHRQHQQIGRAHV